MKAVILNHYEMGVMDVKVGTLPTPKPGPGEVLVKLAASPINPADLMFMQGQYGFKKPLPTIPGFEGSGTVVEAGPGLVPRILVGKRVTVAAASSKDKQGTWAEYLTVPAMTCLRLPDSIDDAQGAMMLINPFTAWALIERVQSLKAKAFVQTAAGSQLGHMIVRLANVRGIPSINIVRREAQANELKAGGMKNVLCSSSSSFESDLSDLTHQLKATVALDAVAGEMPAKLLKSMPNGSRVVVYGGLSLEDPKISIASLIFGGDRLEGFWLSHWFREKNPLQMIWIWKQLQKHASTILKSEVRAKYPLDKVREAISDYGKHMSSGKVLLLPNM